ncbi:hypothetical protein [Rhodococcoides fascians]|uniref:hypothetical protein n=1 Tax=Rhodococcoides fascians TaxID=1828 RepID=UPI00055A97C1|nr:hypothetical protein [Rhodococcus fascians]
MPVDWWFVGLIAAVCAVNTVASGVVARRRSVRAAALVELEEATDAFRWAEAREWSLIGGDWFAHRRAVSELGRARGRMIRARRDLPRRRSW